MIQNANDIAVPTITAYPNFTLHSFQIEAEGFFEYHIFDNFGTELEKGNAVDDALVGVGLPNGLYWIQIKNPTTHKMMRMTKR